MFTELYFVHREQRIGCRCGISDTLQPGCKAHSRVTLRKKKEDASAEYSGLSVTSLQHTTPKGSGATCT
jgi:hypothetical protein